LLNVAGSLVTLEFVDFCVEGSPNCTFDYVELRERLATTTGKIFQPLTVNTVRFRKSFLLYRLNNYQ